MNTPAALDISLPAEAVLLEDAVLAAATLMGSAGEAEPVDDPIYMVELGMHFWNTVRAVRERRG